MKILIVLVIMEVMVAGCGKSEGPAEPPSDEHDQGNIESFYNSLAAPDPAACSRIRIEDIFFVS